jgi:hypothetical protein
LAQPLPPKPTDPPPPFWDTFADNSPLAAFYSAALGDFVTVGRGRSYFANASLGLGKRGETNPWLGHDLARGDSGLVAAYAERAGVPPDHFVVLDGNAPCDSTCASYDVVEYHARFGGPAEQCQEQLTSNFFPQFYSGDLFNPPGVKFPNRTWCRNTLAHFPLDSNGSVPVVALAGFFSYQDGNQHVVVATSDNQVIDLSFPPVNPNGDVTNPGG